MSTIYDAPAELRQLEKMLNSFSYQHGYDIGQVFDDTLRYIIHGFSLDEKPISNWTYKKELNIFFSEYLTEWIRIMQFQLGKSEWYDAFGELYMANIASKSQQSNNGQFFTPIGICDLMVLVGNNQENVIGQCCSDPTCGSGRLLLAWHVRNLGNYLCAEDIDHTCCLMTCCNFLIHGCVGEVICHDSLNPDSYNYGWMINEHLNNPLHKYYGIPTIRSIDKEESRVWHHWQQLQQNVCEIHCNSNNETIPICNEKQVCKKGGMPVQLTLF